VKAERRLAHVVEEAALKSTARTTTQSLPLGAPELLMADSPPVPVDLIALTPSEFDLFLAGYRSGYSHGLDAGRDQADADAAALHRAACRVVQSAAKLDPWPVAQQARRSRQEAAAALARRRATPWPLEAP